MLLVFTPGGLEEAFRSVANRGVTFVGPPPPPPALLAHEDALEG
jgi:hypothetical protein